MHMCENRGPLTYKYSLCSQGLGKERNAREVKFIKIGMHRVYKPGSNSEETAACSLCYFVLCIDKNVNCYITATCHQSGAVKKSIRRCFVGPDAILGSHIPYENTGLRINRTSGELLLHNVMRIVVDVLCTHVQGRVYGVCVCTCGEVGQEIHVYFVSSVWREAR